MGNTNSTEGNNIVASIQRRRSRSNSSASIPQKNTPQPSPRQPFQFSITEPTETTATTNHWEPSEPPITEDSPTKPIQMKRDDPNPPATNTGHSKGWVSSTGAASPWFGYLSSSASSHHRASISGPYYRTRGMSVTRDNENDDDLSTLIGSSSLNYPPKASKPVITDEPVTAIATTDATTNNSSTDDTPTINAPTNDPPTNEDDITTQQPVPSISNTSTNTSATTTTTTNTITTNTATPQPSAPPANTNHGKIIILTCKKTKKMETDR